MGHFSLFLSKCLALTLLKLLAHSKKYINIAKIKIVRQQVEQSHYDNTSQKDKRHDQCQSTLYRKYNNYEPLNALINHTLFMMLMIELMKFPL